MSPNITEADIAAVVEVLRSGQLVQGKNVAALESEVAEYLGIKHVVAVSNGTATLLNNTSITLNSTNSTISIQNINSGTFNLIFFPIHNQGGGD